MSMLKRELERLTSPTPLDPDKLPFKTMLWRILVEPVTAKPMTEGGIALPDMVTDAEKILTSVGRVLQIGEFAFKSKTLAGINLADEPNKPTVGSYVLHERYAGQEIDLRSGRKLRILLDTEILMLVTDPEEIRNYI